MFWINLLDVIFRVVSILGIGAAIAAAAAHYLAFGPHHPELKGEKHDILRMNFWGRFIHAVTLLSFVVLAVTGFFAVIICGGPLTGWLRFIHLTVAPVFVLGLVCVSLTWAEVCAFKGWDWEWAKKFGGYLGHKGEVPADKFNGGQKAFFWAIIALGLVCIASGVGRVYPILGADFQNIVYQAHRYSSLLLVMFVIMHIYLGTVANPGTWQAILSGYVGMHWAKKHHPLWWKRIDKSVESNR